MSIDKKAVLNELWTARWHLRKGLEGEALDYLSRGISILEGAAVVEKPVEERDRPNEVMPDDFMKGITEPEFVVVKGVKFAKNRYQTKSGKFEGLVVHYTVSGRTAASARAVVHWLASKNWGCMVMDEDGKIYIPEGFDIFEHWDDHAGKSKWRDRTSLSAYYAGMEICCWGRNPPASAKGPFRESKGEENIIAGRYECVTPKQWESLINFILWALSKNPEFKIEKICGHDEARTAFGLHGDKQDPGASIPVTMPGMRKLVSEKWSALKS